MQSETARFRFQIRWHSSQWNKNWNAVSFDSQVPVVVESCFPLLWRKFDDSLGYITECWQKPITSQATTKQQNMGLGKMASWQQMGVLFSCSLQTASPALNRLQKHTYY